MTTQLPQYQFVEREVSVRQASARLFSPGMSSAPITPEPLTLRTPAGLISGWTHGPADGIPVLAIHGWLEHADCWLPLLPHVPSHLRIIAIDLPGHGKSDHRGTGMGYAVSDYPRDVYAILELLQLERVHLLGHSMGAMISFLFTGAFPERISSLTLIDGKLSSQGWCLILF